MKKINLLNKAEMKNVKGGVEDAGGSAWCSASCPNDKPDVTCKGTNCTVDPGVKCTATDSNGNPIENLCSDPH